MIRNEISSLQNIYCAYRFQSANRPIGTERFQRPPCVKGKRSAVAGVNDSPVDCQSRDRTARKRLSPHSGDWGIVTTSTTPPSRLSAVTPYPYTGEAFRCGGTRHSESFLEPPARCICQGKVDTEKHHSFRSPVRSCTELGFYSPKRPQVARKYSNGHTRQEALGRP